MKSYIYENITELSCQVGKFSVSCEDKKIPFSIRKNKYDIPYYDITTETNYALDIDTNLLEIKKAVRYCIFRGRFALLRL